MIKKLLFTFIILIAVVVVSLKLDRQRNLNEVAIEIQSDNVIPSLEQEGLSSIVVLTHNDENSLRAADRLMTDLSKNQKIKVLAFEIYTKNSIPERLMEIAYTNGEPDIFYVSGNLVQPKTIADYVRNELEQHKRK